MPLVFPCPPAALPAFLFPVCGDATPAEGGLYMLVYAALDIETTIPDPTVQANWDAAIAANDVRFLTPILGQMPEASDTETRTQSNKPPKVTNRLRTITFEDHNTADIAKDNTATYNTVEANAGGYKWGALGTNGFFYGWIDNATFRKVRVIDPNGDDGVMKFMGQIAWFQKDDIAPIQIPDGTIILV